MNSALVSSGPNKKPFSVKEKKPGDGEAGQSPEDTPFQHSPLGKPVVRAAAGTLLSKRCGRSFLWAPTSVPSAAVVPSMAGTWATRRHLGRGKGAWEGERRACWEGRGRRLGRAPGCSLVSLSPVSRALVLAPDVYQCVRGTSSLKRSNWL